MPCEALAIQRATPPGKCGDLPSKIGMYIVSTTAGVAELADAQDLGTKNSALQTKDLFQKHRS